MRKVFLLVAVVAAIAAWGAASASATIHPLSCSERSNAPLGTPAQLQDPPGITNEGHTPGYTDPDPDNNVQARPIVAIMSNSTTSDNSNALKPPGC